MIALLAVAMGGSPRCAGTWYDDQARLAELVAGTAAAGPRATLHKQRLELGLRDMMSLARALRALDDAGRGCSLRCADPFLAAASTLARPPSPEVSRRLAHRWRDVPLGGWFATQGIDGTPEGVGFAREWMERGDPDAAIAEAVVCRADPDDAELLRAASGGLDEQMVDARVYVAGRWVALGELDDAERVVAPLAGFASRPLDHPRCFDRQPLVETPAGDGAVLITVSPGQFCPGLLTLLSRVDRALEDSGRVGVDGPIAELGYEVPPVGEPRERVWVRVELDGSPWVSARCPLSAEFVRSTPRALRSGDPAIRRAAAEAWACDDARLAGASAQELTSIAEALGGSAGRLALPLASRWLGLGDVDAAARVLEGSLPDLLREESHATCRDDGWTSPERPDRSPLSPSYDCAQDRGGLYALVGELPEPARSRFPDRVEGFVRDAVQACAPSACGRVAGLWDGSSWTWRTDPGTASAFGTCVRDAVASVDQATDVHARVVVSGRSACAPGRR